MTKKHFIALADALREQKPQQGWSMNKHVQWDMDVRAVCKVLAASNVNFNQLLWMQYVNGLCTTSGKPIK